MSDVVNVDDDDDVVVVEVRSLVVSDVKATSVELSWSLGDTRHVDVVQINQTRIDFKSVSVVYNASSNTSHTTTGLSAGTEYEFYVQVQSDSKTARTDAARVTTGATPTDDHPSSLGLFSVSK